MDPLLFPLTLRARTCVSKSEEDEHDPLSGSTALVMRRQKHSRNKFGKLGSACRNKMSF